MAMKEPRSWVVGIETNSDVVSSRANIDSITKDGVNKVRSGLTGTTDDMECVLKE